MFQMVLYLRQVIATIVLEFVSLFVRIAMGRVTEANYQL